MLFLGGDTPKDLIENTFNALYTKRCLYGVYSWSGGSRTEGVQRKEVFKDLEAVKYVYSKKIFKNMNMRIFLSLPQVTTNF